MLVVAALLCVALAFHPVVANVADCRRQATTWVEIMDLNRQEDWTCGEVSRRILAMNMNQNLRNNVHGPLTMCNAHVANSPAHPLFGAIPCLHCPAVANNHACAAQPGDGWYIMLVLTKPQEDTPTNTKVDAHFMNVFVDNGDVTIVHGCADNFKQRVNDMNMNDFMTGYRGLVAGSQAASPITNIMCYGATDLVAIAGVNLVGPLPTNHCATTLNDINTRIITDFTDKAYFHTCKVNPHGKWKRLKKAVKETVGNYQCMAPGFKFP